VFFPDLGAYSYYTTAALPRVKAVGWLDCAHPFTTGPIPKDALEKLKLVIIGNEGVDAHVNPIRGIHPCNLCRIDDFPNSELRIGSSEIWIPDGQKGFYASPSMIYHYIVEHRYLPPQVFIDALEQFDVHSKFDAQAEYVKLASEVMSL